MAPLGMGQVPKTYPSLGETVDIVQYSMFFS
jgi:hypothetical protein